MTGTRLLLTSLLALLFLAPATNRVVAAELIMLEQDGCPWCEQWNEDIGVVYHKTSEGKVAPLRRVNIYDKIPDDLKGLVLGNFTPTFVLWHEGGEVARLRGYPGDEFFWTLLDEMLEKLPKSYNKPSG